ncbi:programmed cell death protein [Dinochytrium kinnereticum]|nr:programmed cell death protein [Dinochytrium kinnereticum]
MPSDPGLSAGPSQLSASSHLDVIAKNPIAPKLQESKKIDALRVAIQMDQTDSAWKLFRNLLKNVNRMNDADAKLNLAAVGERRYRQFLKLLALRLHRDARRSYIDQGLAIEAVIKAMIKAELRVLESDYRRLLYVRLFVDRIPFDRLWQNILEHWPVAFGRQGKTRSAFLLDVESYRMLMSAAIERGSWKDLCRVYDEMKNASVPLTNSAARIFMSLFRREHSVPGAKDLYRRMIENDLSLDVEMFQDLIITVARVSDDRAVDEYLAQMDRLGILPTKEILNSALGCKASRRSPLEPSLERFRRHGIDRDLATLTILVKAFCNMDRYSRDHIVPMVTSTASMLLKGVPLDISTAAARKQIASVIGSAKRSSAWAYKLGKIFDILYSVCVSSDVKPSAMAFSQLLSIVIRLKEPSLALHILSLMNSRNVPPDADHYGTALLCQLQRDDGLGARAIRDMMIANGVAPDRFYYHRLIKACFFKGDVANALRVFRMLVRGGDDTASLAPSDKRMIDAHIIAYVLSELQRRAGPRVVNEILSETLKQLPGDPLWSSPRLSSFFLRHSSLTALTPPSSSHRAPRLRTYPERNAGTARTPSSIKVVHNIKSLQSTLLLFRHHHHHHHYQCIDSIVASAYLAACAREVREISIPTHTRLRRGRRRRRRTHIANRRRPKRAVKVTSMLRTLKGLGADVTDIRVLKAALDAAVILRDHLGAQRVLDMIGDNRMTPRHVVTQVWSKAAVGDAKGAQKVFKRLHERFGGSKNFHRTLLRRATEGVLVAFVRSGNFQGSRAFLKGMMENGVVPRGPSRRLMRRRMPRIFFEFFGLPSSREISRPLEGTSPTPLPEDVALARESATPSPSPKCEGDENASTAMPATKKAVALTIGGKPLWLDMKTEPSPALASCRNCGRSMYLVAQILAALPGRKERILYVFACNQKGCMSAGVSWVVLRAIKPQKPKQKTSTPVKPFKKQNPTTPSSSSSKGTNQSKIASFQETPLKTTVKTPSRSSLSQLSFGSGESWGDESQNDSWGAASDDPVSLEQAFGTMRISAKKSEGGGSKSAIDQRNEIEDLLAARDKRMDPETATPRSKKKKGKKETSYKADEKAVDIKDDKPATGVPAFELTESIASSNDISPLGPSKSDAWAKSDFFPGYFLEFDYEETPEQDSSEQYTHEMKLLEQYRKSGNVIDLDSPGEGGGEDGMSWAGESYEKIRPKHYDKVFKKFQKAVEKVPEQCLRYSFKGTPLFYATDVILQNLSTSGPPPCPKCSSPRVFEMQIMPSILSILPTEQYASRIKREEEKALRATADNHSKQSFPTQADVATVLSQMSVGMDFGTVLVYTCEKDCGVEDGGADVVYLEEFAAVQQERWQ